MSHDTSGPSPSSSRGAEPQVLIQTSRAGFAQPFLALNAALVHIASQVDRGLTRTFGFIGCQIGHRPWTTIILSIACAGACCAGFKRVAEDTSNTLFTPPGAQSLKDRGYIQSVFGNAVGAMSIDLYASRRGETGENILNKEGLLEFKRLWDHAVKDVTVAWQGNDYGLRDICSPVSSLNEDCEVRSILQAFNFNRNGEIDNIQDNSEIIDVVNSDSFTDVYGRPMHLPSVLGGIERDGAGRVVAAKAMASTISLEYSLERERIGNEDDTDPLLAKWPQEVANRVRNFDEDFLSVFVLNEAVLSSESSKVIDGDITSIIGGYILLIGWAFISLWRNSWVYQKAHLAPLSVFAIILGSVAAFGICLACNVKINTTVQAVPFLLLGLGMDDTFVIVGAYFRQDRRKTARERIQGTMEVAGTSITVTTFTDFIAFILGQWTDFPAMKALSAYSAAGIMFVYVYQVTFFTACLTLDAYREDRALHGHPNAGFVCCCTDTSELENTRADEERQELGEAGKNNSGHVPPVGGALDCDSNCVVKQNMEREGHTGNDKQSLQQASVTAITSKSSMASIVDFFTGKSIWDMSKSSTHYPGDEEPRDFTSELCVPIPKFSWLHWYSNLYRYDPHSPPPSTWLAGVLLPKGLLHWSGMVFVFLVEAAGLAVAIYGCTRVYEDFQRQWLVPEGHWLREAYNMEEKYFQGLQTKIDIYTRAAPEGESYFSLQDQLAAIPSIILSSPYMSDTPPFVSWYTQFLEFLADKYGNQLDSQGRPQSQGDFMTWLREWLGTPKGAAFEDDIVLSPDGQSIIASKMTGFSQNYEDATWAVELTDDIRARAAQAAPALDAIAFSPAFFSYDSYRVVVDNTLRTVIAACVAVFVVMVIMLASIQGSLLVLAMVVLSDVGLFGFMHFAGLNLNSITFIILVIAVGIAVDFSGHVCRAFLVEQGTRKERAEKALYHIGGEVLNGAFSTWLAVIVLAGANHYIFHSFFMLLFALVVLAIWHGIIFLPVCLAIVGPPSYSTPEDSANAGSEDCSSGESVGEVLVKLEPAP